MKRFSSVIVDTLENLENSNVIIPDGFIVKVANESKFKVGNGINNWSTLEIGVEGKSAYDIAINAGFEGTQEEWLDTLKGAPGIEGPIGPTGPTGNIGSTGPIGNTPVFRVVDYDAADSSIGRKIQVSYQQGEENSYVDLLDVSTLAGPSGEKGSDGAPFKIVEIFTSITDMVAAQDEFKFGDIVLINTYNINDEDNGKLYIKGDEEFSFLVDLSGIQGIQGPAGATPLLRNTGTSVQYSYDNINWFDLLSLADIDGISPLLRNNNDAIEVNYGTLDWYVLVELATLRGKEGPLGPKGNTGDPGPGISIKKIYTSLENMQADINAYAPYDCVILATDKGNNVFKNDVYIKDTSTGIANWRFMVSFESAFPMQGPKGDPGKDGTSVLSSDIIIRTRNGYIEASTDAGLTYTQIVLLQLLKPANPVFRFLNGWLQHSQTGAGGPFTNLIEQTALQGPVGPKLNFEDLTEENKEELRGPVGNTGETGPVAQVDFRFKNGSLEVATDTQIANDDYKPIISEEDLIGPSAYEIAKKGGYIGTEAEWLTSLIGPIGPKGRIGDSLKILGGYANIEDLPDIGNSGDAYLIGRALYVWTPSENSGAGGWINAGDLKGLDGDFVEIPKHDAYIVDEPGMLRFFIKNFVPSNFIETDVVKLLSITENAALYDIIGDKYADKILEVDSNKDDENQPIYTEVPAGYFVLDKFVLNVELTNAGFTSAICAYVDSLHYNTVGEVIFVHENDIELDNRVWLKADGTTSYAKALYPEVANVFARAHVETIAKNNFPSLTSNATTIDGILWNASAYNDAGTNSEYSSYSAFKAFNGIDSSITSNAWISASSNVYPKYLELKCENNSDRYLYKYSITTPGSIAPYVPVTWELQGCTSPNGVNWVTLDSIKTPVVWNKTVVETQTFYISNNNTYNPNSTKAQTYSKFRLKILSSSDSAYVAVGALKLYTFTKEEYLTLPEFKVPDLTNITPTGMTPYFRIRGDLKLNYEGKEGKNTFETMVSKGYTGTYEQWINDMRGPSGYVSVFNEIPNIASLPMQGKEGIGYIIGPDLWIWDGTQYKNAGRWKTASLYEESVNSGYNDTEENFNKIIRNLTVADVKSWEIAGTGNTQYVLEGANSSNPESYIVTLNNSLILTPHIDYTVKSGGFIIFAEPLNDIKTAYIREFNYATNVDRYSNDNSVGETLDVLIGSNPGLNYIELFTDKVKLVKKSQYPELYAIVGDKWTLLPEPLTYMNATMTPNMLGTKYINADAVSNTLLDATSAILPTPYKFAATTEVASYEAWRAFTKSSIATNTAGIAGWVSNGASPQQWMFSTGSEARHKLFKYYIGTRPGDAQSNYPKSWVVYYTTNPDLTLSAVDTGTDPSAGWVAIDTRTEVRSGFTSGMSSNIGALYNIPNADDNKPFAAIKIKILSHYGTTATASTLGRLQLFTIDTNDFEENIDFKLNEYFALPPSDNLQEGFTRYIKAKPTINKPIKYLTDYELWLSNGYTGTYDEYLLSRAPEVVVDKAFRGNMSTLIKRFDFYNESLDKAVGFNIPITNRRAKYYIKSYIKPVIAGNNPTVWPLIQAVNGTVVDTTLNYTCRDISWNSSSGGNSSTTTNNAGFFGGYTDINADTNPAISECTLQITEDGYVLFNTNSSRLNQTKHSILTGTNIIPWNDLTAFKINTLNVSNAKYTGWLEIYEEKTVTPIEMHSKEVILENTYFQQNINKSFTVDFGTDVELTLTTDKPFLLNFSHDDALVKGPVNSSYEIPKKVNNTDLLEIIRDGLDITTEVKFNFQQNKISVSVVQLTSMADGITKTEKAYFITPTSSVFNKTYSINVNKFTGTCKITKDIKSHSISANPDAISGLTIIKNTVPNTFTIQPGGLDVDGSLAYNYRTQDINIFDNIGDREVLDKNLPIFVYAWQSDLHAKTLEFRCTYSAPLKDRYNNTYTDWKDIPDGIGRYLIGSDKTYRLIGVVRYLSIDSSDVIIEVPTLKQDYSYKISYDAVPTATKDIAGKIKITKDALDFSDDENAVSPKQLQSILSQNTVKDFTFIGNGTLNSWQLDSNYQSKDLLVIAGGEFMSPSKYTIIDGKLSFLYPIPAGIEISVRTLFNTVNARSDYKTAEIASRLSMYILHNNDSL